MATKFKGEYVYPQIPKDIYPAVTYACAEIRKNGFFNVAIRKASKRYGVDEDELKALIRERQAAGQRYKNAVKKEASKTTPPDFDEPELDALDREYAELNAERKDINAKIESLREKIVAVFEETGLDHYKAVNATYSFYPNRTQRQFDTSRFKEEHPALYEDYVREVERAPLYVRFL